MLPTPVLSQPQNHFWIRTSMCLKLLSCMSVVPMVSVDDLLITAVKTLSGETTSNSYNNNSSLLDSNLLMQLRAIFVLIGNFFVVRIDKITSTIICFLKCWWFFYKVTWSQCVYMTYYSEVPLYFGWKDCMSRLFQFLDMATSQLTPRYNNYYACAQSWHHAICTCLSAVPRYVAIPTGYRWAQNAIIKVASYGLIIGLGGNCLSRVP